MPKELEMETALQSLANHTMQSEKVPKGMDLNLRTTYAGGAGLAWMKHRPGFRQNLYHTLHFLKDTGICTHPSTARLCHAVCVLYVKQPFNPCTLLKHCFFFVPWCRKHPFELTRFQSSPLLTAARDKCIRMQGINNLRQQF